LKIVLILFVAVALLYALQAVLRRRVNPTAPQPKPRPILMDEQQARDVLGLDPTSSDADVVDAHRRLMQKLHPDKGGSAYLAQQLNEAKRVLLQK
jgi:hypothetical protein